MHTLQGKGFWGFIEGSEDPLSPFPVVPMPIVATGATAPALRAHREWWQKDAKVKDIIEHCISPVVSTIIPCAETTQGGVRKKIKHIMSKFFLRPQG